MWKKSELDEMPPVTKPARPEPRVSAPTQRDGASIGPSISIRGEVSGEEDLLIRGRVEGTVNLKEHNVTVGRDGHVHAEVRARVVDIEGHLEGDIHGVEQVIVRSSGDVTGSVNAPRVSLESGCRFKGSIDMGAPVETAAAKTPSKVADIAGSGAPRKPGSRESTASREKHAL